MRCPKLSTLNPKPQTPRCELSVRLDFSKNMYTLIDVLAVVPLPIRIATGPGFRIRDPCTFCRVQGLGFRV